jgi:H+-transporting ATPase
VDGIEISRCIFSRMKSFLTYRIAATLQLLLFFFIAVFAFDPKLYNTAYPVDFFSIPVLFLMCITVINDGTLISIGYDYASPSKYPERWVLPALFAVASAIMIVAMGSSLLLLHWCLASSQPGSLFQNIGISGSSGLVYGHIVTAIFLKVAISDILSLFSCRTADKFFFQKKPHPALFGACVIAVIVSTLIALLVPCNPITIVIDGVTYNSTTTLDHVPICGLAYNGANLLALWVWIYCIVCFFIQDVLKVITWRLLIRYNAWNINNEVGFVPSAFSRAMDLCYKSVKCWGKKTTRRERKGSAGKVEVVAASTHNLATGPSIVEHKGHH